MVGQKRFGSLESGRNFGEDTDRRRVEGWLEVRVEEKKKRVSIREALSVFVLQRCMIQKYQKET
jgi:hypothetical protein